MKKIMKKVLSLALVVALAIAPMTVMAAVGDPVAMPSDCIYSGDTVTVEAGQTKYFEIGTWPELGTLGFVVEGMGNFEVAPCTEGSTEPYAEGTPIVAVNGKVETTITSYESTYGYAAFSIKNNTDASADYVCTIKFPEGSQGNPKAVTLSVGSNVNVTVSAGKQYYLAVTLPEIEKEYKLTVTGNTGFSCGGGMGMPIPDTNGTYNGTIATYYGAATFAISNNTSSEQTYTLVLDNMPLGSESNPAALTVNYSVQKELEGEQYWYTWTATEAGLFKFQIVEELTTPRWSYNVSSDNLAGTSFQRDKGESAECEVNLETGDSVKIGVWVPTYYDSIDYVDRYTPADGTVVFMTSFEAGQSSTPGGSGSETPSGGNTSSGDNYVGSESPLVNGNNTVSTEKDYTIFTFQPTEIGKYTFTSTDGSKLAIASYNGMWVTTTPSTETVKETSLSWECTDTQQSIWLAVKAPANSDKANVLIIKEDIQIVEIEKEIYKNTVTPSTFAFSGDANKLEYVETSDKNVDKAVLGKDGYYHLNSEDGAILFVDLDDDLMNLPLALDRGDVCHVIYDRNNVATKKIIYSDALKAYLACADSKTKLYPLTADLIEIYQKAGETQGWYGNNGFVGGTEADAWMFACYYQKGLNTLGNSGAAAPGGATQAPNTGDNANVAVWAIVMVVAAGAAFVVAESKRRAR